MTGLIATPPCALPGAPSPVRATGRTLNWGIAGTGRIARLVAGDLALLEDARILAVSSRDAGRAGGFARDFGVARSYHDGPEGRGFRRLFADPDVDVVYIATPHGQHYEIAREALEAGKHVLCEKSLTINAAEAVELAALAESLDLFLMEAVWTRFLPAVHRVLGLVADGAVGDVAWLRADLGFPAPDDPSSRLWSPDAGGGALLDLAVYPLTWALGILGFPQQAQAAGDLNDAGVDPQESITLTYAGGRQAQLMCSLRGSGPREAIISGTAGWIRVHNPMHNPAAFELHPLAGGPRSEEFIPVGRNYTYELRETTRCIQAGVTESPTMPLEDTVATMRLFDGLRNQLGLVYANDRAR